MNDVKKAIKDYINQSANVNDIDDDCMLFEEGIVSSLFVVQLMIFLEKTFSIKVKMDDLNMDNFKSVNEIAKFVTDKKNKNV